MLGWQRLQALADNGTYVDIEGKEAEPSACDGVYAGQCKIDGIDACIIVQEREYLAGTMGVRHVKRMYSTLRLAKKKRLPLVSLIDSAGARFQEGNDSLEHVSALLKEANTGSVFHVSAVLGSAAGGSAYFSASSDLLIMKKDSSIFIWGPALSRYEFGMSFSVDELGGASLVKSTVPVGIVAEDETDAINSVKKVVSLLYSDTQKLNSSQSINDRLASLLDQGTLMELFDWGESNVTCGLARIRNKPVCVCFTGKDGSYLSYEDTLKIYSTLEFCRRTGIDFLNVIDSSGFSPFPEDNKKGIIQLCNRIARILVGRKFKVVSLIKGKCLGGLYVLLASKKLCSDHLFALNGSVISVAPRKTFEEITKKKIDYDSAFNAFSALNKGYIDSVLSEEDAVSAVRNVFS